MDDLYPIYLYSLYAGAGTLFFIILGFFFMYDEKDNFGGVDVDLEAEALGDTTSFIWQWKGILGPLAIGVLMFGLVGVGCTKRDMDPTDTLVCASGLALVLTLVLGYFAHQTSKPAEWTIPIRAAVGKSGTVTALIPPRGSGTGKVQVAFGQRVEEYPATTHQDEIAVDATVLVVGVTQGSVLEVTGSSSYTLSTGQHT
ncbi:MAG: hypothetical protein AB7K24_11555 [Gemmataceae bacterium]